MSLVYSPTESDDYDMNDSLNKTTSDKKLNDVPLERVMSSKVAMHLMSTFFEVQTGHPIL